MHQSHIYQSEHRPDMTLSYYEGAVLPAISAYNFDWLRYSRRHCAVVSQYSVSFAVVYPY